jgi:hypothetical protein
MKQQYFKRKISISAQAWATNNYTLTTGAAHGIAVGESIVLFDVYSQSSQTYTTAGGTTGSTIVIADTNNGRQFNVDFFVTYYTANTTTTVESPGASLVTYQATVTTSSGNGAATVNIQASNDNIGWLSLGTITLAAAASPNSDGFALQAPWLYTRAVITGISGTNAKFYISYNV